MHAQCFRPFWYNHVESRKKYGKVWAQNVCFISDYRSVGNIFRFIKQLASQVQDARRSSSGLRIRANWTLFVRETHVTVNS